MMVFRDTFKLDNQVAHKGAIHTGVTVVAAPSGGATFKGSNEYTMDKTASTADERR